MALPVNPMPDESEERVDCLVVGAGPAGLTAAMYLRRFHRRVRVVDEGDSRALRIPVSHNAPGFPYGIRGIDLLDRLGAQLAHARGAVTRGSVTELSKRDGGFVAMCGGASVRCATVLLATGVRDHEPDLPGVDAVRRAGLLRQCPVCDGYEHSGQRIAVIGRGEHGVREALFIRDFSDRVCYVALHGEDIDAEGSRRLAMHGVRCVVGGVRGIGRDTHAGVHLTMEAGGDEHFDVVYAALGCRPRADLAAGLGAKLDARGNVVVDGHCETTVPGLYAAGDVVSALDQLAVAVGHAAIAATAIHNRLRGEQ
jgi:thioredoxin reductase (NADPH)